MVLKVFWIKILFIKLTSTSKHSLLLAKTCIEVHLLHDCMPLEPFLVFLQQTCPFHYFRSKTHVLDGFAPFHCCTWPVSKICIGVHLLHEFMLRSHFLFGSNEHSQSTTLGLKLMFTNSAWYLIALLHSFWRQLM